MARPRSPRSKKPHAAVKQDALAVTRAGPAVDELAETREGEVVTLVALLDAAEGLLAERAFTHVSVEDVAQRAGVSVDVFHAHFAGKGGLLRALNDRFVEQMVAAVDASTRTGSWSNSHIRDVVEIAVRTILDVIEDRRGLVRAFLAHGATDGALAAGLRKIGNHMTARLVTVLGGCKDAKRSPASPQSVGFALLLSVALAHHCVLVGEEWAGVGLTRAQLTEELTTAISAYLSARGPS